jgi:hypothetical protein
MYLCFFNSESCKKQRAIQNEMDSPFVEFVFCKNLKFRSKMELDFFKVLLSHL